MSGEASLGHPDAHVGPADSARSDLRLYPGTYARLDPERTAQVIAETGDAQTYSTLDERSRRFAAALRNRGLQPGGHIALSLENRLEFMEVSWAAQRAGLYYTPISPRLHASEMAYLIHDCDARVLVGSAAAPALTELDRSAIPQVNARFYVGAPADGFESYEDALTNADPTPPAFEPEGQRMLYSSGTTGRPKGIIRKLSGLPVGTPPDRLSDRLARLYDVNGTSIFLSPAPLYHGAPLGFTLSSQRLGATVVLTQAFDAERLLKTIEHYQVTHVQCVPTMLIRLLRLPAAVRARYDLSSLQCVIHSAAPCPVPIKRALIDWIGPIVHEYYAGSEGTGFCIINSEEWLAHPGSVGRPVDGEVNILDENGVELPAGETGYVYFSTPSTFEYYKLPEATAAAFDEKGRTTLGDIGHITDGFLYLTDRRNFTIISGGINVYPQEVENALGAHPSVADVAVLGKPHPELGEAVLAVVQPEVGVSATPQLEAALIAYCKSQLASYKCPKQIVFDYDFPRGDNGKLYKRVLRERYGAS